MYIKKYHTCTGHNGALYCLTEGASSRHFLTAGGDGWIVEWSLDDPETGRLIASIDTQVFALCSMPDRNLLVAGNMQGGVHWIRRDQPDQTRNVQHHHKSVYALLASGEYLYSAAGDGILTRWSLEQGRAEESLQLSGSSLRSLALHPERRLLAIGASDHSIALVDPDNMRLEKSIPAAHTSSVFATCFSPDGRYLLSGGRDAMLRVWDVEQDYRLVSEQPAHLYTINHIEYAPDGRHFATASRDKTVKIWDASSFQLLKVIDTIRLGGHINSVNRLLWTNEALVSCSDDRTAAIWTVE